MNHIDEFTRFAELLPEAMLLLGGDGRILAVNRQLSTLLAGVPAAELVGRDLAEVAATPAAEVAGWLRTCARTRELMPGTLEFTLPNGRSLLCRAAGARYGAEPGGPVTVLARLLPRREAVNSFISLNLRIEQLTLEVRRRREAEQSLHAERETLRVTLESIGDAVIATDEHGRVTFLNPVAEALTGWRRDEAVRRDIAEVFVIVNEYTRASVESPVDRVIREGVVVGLANHTLLIRRDGSEIAIDDSGAPIRDDRGRLQGVVLVFHDITDRRHLERELEARNRRLLEADQRKDEFLAMLAHELRNPLAPLRTGIHILRAAGREPDTLEQVGEMMDRQVQHLTRLVDDLLDVSRITRGRIELHRRLVVLQDVLHHALEMVEEQLDARDLRLSVSLPPEPLVVEGDATRLAQVFSNLLSNAAKFTDPGGDVAVGLEPAANTCAVRIRDTGVGIEADTLDEIFELFAQADRSLDRSQGGLGLGLTVAKQVVELHGGTIVAHSEGLGRGSEFVVTLPARGPAVSPGAAPVEAAGTKELPAVDARRVLVVDDNRDAAAMLEALVSFWGHDCRVAHDGPGALQVAAEFRPHVVLLDLGLPGLDGYEVARRMRRDPALAAARIVAVTGYGRDADRHGSGVAGFDDHLTKPVDPDVVQRLLLEI